ncbi:hypothetical protein [Solidesulfovibrio sp.]
MTEKKLIEMLRREAVKLGMSETELFMKVREVLADAQKVDIFGLNKRLLEQRENMEIQRKRVDDQANRGSRKTNGTLEFPV